MEPTGTSGAISVAGDVAAASVALAGLILVFLGSISTAYDAYTKQEQPAVRSKYQRRAWFALIGFVLALSASFFAILGKWHGVHSAAQVSIWLLFVALVWVLLVAVIAVIEIR